MFYYVIFIWNFIDKLKEAESGMAASPGVAGEGLEDLHVLGKGHTTSARSHEIHYATR